MPPLPVAGSVVIGQERQYAAGNAYGKIQGQHVQLLYDPQRSHCIGVVGGHKLHQCPYCHHGQQILGTGGKADFHYAAHVLSGIPHAAGPQRYHRAAAPVKNAEEQKQRTNAIGDGCSQPRPLGSQSQKLRQHE